MVDGLGREINYLRISVTDRCNLRCRYCMPEHGVDHINHTEVLRLEEIARLVKIMSGWGITKVRITGGEPLLRKNLPRLFKTISTIPEIDDLALTTNGIHFQDLAVSLKAAGLRRVNFSLDTLKEERHRFITRRSASVVTVMKAIELALALNLEPVKLNVVIIRGFNDDELLNFAELARQLSLHVRFIEFMPIGNLLYWDPQRLIGVDEMKARLEQHYELIPEQEIYGNGPARYYSLPGGQGSLGFINPISNHFCSKCNRLRLTAGGTLRACLYDQRETDLKSALRGGASDDQLRAMMIDTILHKPEKHDMEGWGNSNRRYMYQIGG